MRGFPHSEIPGSKLICSSPRLIAACHVLLRLLMPRHSPYALFRLNFLYSLVLLNCLSFLNKIIIFRIEKVFSFSCRLSTFRWNCIASFDAFTLFWKDSINFSIFVLFNLFVSLTHSSKFKFEFFRLPIRLSSFIMPSVVRLFFSRRSPVHFPIVWRLSYSVVLQPSFCRPASGLVGLDGLEPSTSRLSGARSSHLSYRPVFSHLAYSVQSINKAFALLVEMKGIEPLTPCLQGRCSPSWATPPYSWVAQASKLKPDNWTTKAYLSSATQARHLSRFVFCPNLTTRSQTRPACLASRSP